MDDGGREKTGVKTYSMALSQQHARLVAGQDEVSAAGISVVLIEDISPIPFAQASSQPERCQGM